MIFPFIVFFTFVIIPQHSHNLSEVQMQIQLLFDNKKRETEDLPPCIIQPQTLFTEN